MSVFVSFMVKVYAKQDKRNFQPYAVCRLSFLDVFFMLGTSDNSSFLCYSKDRKYVLLVQDFSLKRVAQSTVYLYPKGKNLYPVGSVLFRPAEEKLQIPFVYLHQFLLDMLREVFLAVLFGFARHGGPCLGVVEEPLY